jgi:hypothetical protein
MGGEISRGSVSILRNHFFNCRKFKRITYEIENSEFATDEG